MIMNFSNLLKRKWNQRTYLFGAESGVGIGVILNGISKAMKFKNVLIITSNKDANGTKTLIEEFNENCPGTRLNNFKDFTIDDDECNVFVYPISEIIKSVVLDNHIIGKSDFNSKNRKWDFVIVEVSGINEYTNLKSRAVRALQAVLKNTSGNISRVVFLFRDTKRVYSLSL